MSTNLHTSALAVLSRRGLNNQAEVSFNLASVARQLGVERKQVVALVRHLIDGKVLTSPLREPGAHGNVFRLGSEGPMNMA